MNTRYMKRKQQPSPPKKKLTTKQQSFFPTTILLLFHHELIIAIASFKEQGFEVVIAMTCKTLYRKFQKFYIKRTAVVLYDSQDNDTHSNSIKALQNRNYWIRFKFIPISDFQSGRYLVNALRLGENLQLPQKLDCGKVSTLRVASSAPSHFTTNISFFGRFTNLKSFELKNFSFSEYIASIFSKLHSLEFIYLSSCNATGCDPSKMFVNCLLLKEIHLTGFKYRYDVPLSLPAKLTRLEMQKCPESFEIDASRCMQFISLIFHGKECTMKFDVNCTLIHGESSPTPYKFERALIDMRNIFVNCFAYQDKVSGLDTLFHQRQPRYFDFSRFEIFNELRFFKEDATNIDDTFKCAFPRGTLYIVVGLFRKTQLINVLEMKLHPAASIKTVTLLNLLDIKQIQEIDL